MTIPDWPWQLPAFPKRGTLTETPGSSTIKFSPDVGPPLLRRRSTIIDDEIAFELPAINCDQKQILKHFYTTTCAQGSITFYMRNPDGSSKPYKQLFQWSESPTITAIGFKDYHSVVIKLRRIN